MKEIPIFEEVLQCLVKQPNFWMKMVIGGLLSFIPVVNFLAFGFLYRVSTQVQNEGTTKLPEWTDWNGLFRDGIRLVIVWLFYWLIPMLVAWVLRMFLGVVGLAALGYLLVSSAFVLFSVLFGAAIYRYNRTSDFKSLLEVSLVVRMAYHTFPKMVVPAFFFLGVFALNPALYGLTIFFGFTLIVVQTSLIYSILEKGGTSAN